MELVINISKWPDDSPLEHIGTDIIIKDEDDIELFPEERITGNIWVKEIDIPVGSTYYVTERKIFKVRDLPIEDQTITYESIVHTVTNDDESISNMILKEYVTIEKPTVILKLKDIEDKDVDFIFSTGDLVGYMPYPNQVIDLIRKHKICSVQGNHDRAIANGNKVGEEITCTIEKVEYNLKQLIEDINKNRMISDALVEMLTKGI